MDVPFNLSVRTGGASLAESALFDELLRRSWIARSLHDMPWGTVEDLADHVAGAIGSAAYRWIDYLVPDTLQEATVPRLRKDYPARLAYIDSDPRGAGEGAVICLGGIVNSARRFDFLAADLGTRHRVVAIDWPGRGRSGWLAQQSHYTPAVLAHAVLSLIERLGLSRIALVGSSLGGSIGIDIAVRRPGLVRHLILNDIGPEMPAERRIRRAETISRHHVFPTPAELFRRAGAAQKHDGPIGDAVRLHNIMGQTKRCDGGGGREYRHDPRATQAYAAAAVHDIDQWSAFLALQCPVLLLHGEESDALLPDTVRRMQAALGPQIAVAHVPATGHTPALADSDSLALIAARLSGQPLPGEFTLPRRPPPVRLLFTADAALRPAPSSSPPCPVPSPPGGPSGRPETSASPA